MDYDSKQELLVNLYVNLMNESPVLSGNMQSMIMYNGLDVRIYAPFYDLKKWNKDKVIVHTGESINGYTDYAQWVNKVGGFGRHNKSEHWVNRVCNQCAEEFAKKYNGKVIRRLPR